MRSLLLSLVFVLAACGVRGPPRPPRPPQQPAPVTDVDADETTATDTTTLELIR